MKDGVTMPSTTQDKLFKVAKGLAGGETVMNALLSAGYAEGTARGKQLRWTGPAGERMKGPPSEHPVVAQHLKDIQAKAQRGAVVTIHSVIADLQAAYQEALTLGKPSAMVSAAMGQAKVLGLIVERRHHTIKRVDELTESEILAMLGETDAAGPTLQ